MWRELDYIGNELERGVITVMRGPGKRYAAGEYVGYKMKGGLIRINGRARSIGPILGGIIWVNEVDEVVYPNKEKIYVDDQVDLQSFYYQEEYGRGEILDKLLREADDYDWSLVEDVSISKTEKDEKLEYFKKIIEDSGINLDGSILEFDAGAVSIGHFYPDPVAMDSDQKMSNTFVKLIEGEMLRISPSTLALSPLNKEKSNTFL